MPQPGECVGNYRLVKILNSGAFGQVFYAEHTMLAQRQVAIKFLRLERLNDSREREQFLHEAHILNRLKHSAILPIWISAWRAMCLTLLPNMPLGEHCEPISRNTPTNL